MPRKGQKVGGKGWKYSSPQKDWGGKQDLLCVKRCSGKEGGCFWGQTPCWRDMRPNQTTPAAALKLPPYSCWVHTPLHSHLKTSPNCSYQTNGKTSYSYKITTSVSAYTYSWLCMRMAQECGPDIKRMSFYDRFCVMRSQRKDRKKRFRTEYEIEKYMRARRAFSRNL